MGWRKDGSGMRELICRGTDWLPHHPSLSFKVKHKFSTRRHTHTHLHIYTHNHTHRTHTLYTRILSWASSNFHRALGHPTVNQHTHKHKRLLITESSTITILNTSYSILYGSIVTNVFWLGEALAAQGMGWVT